MPDEAAVETMQAPALRAQSHTEVEFLVAVQIAVRQISDLFDRLPSIETAAVHAVDRTDPVLRRNPAAAPHIFETGLVHLVDMAGDAGHRRVGLEISEGCGQEVWIEQHVAVHQADEGLAAVLEAELRTDAAARADRRFKLDDADRIVRRDAERMVARTTVGHDDLTTDSFEGC